MNGEYVDGVEERLQDRSWSDFGAEVAMVGEVVPEFE
jgi:hypothetical protein